ncbi:MAG: hypothetical protein WCG98_06395 [bacterium]
MTQTVALYAIGRVLLPAKASVYVPLSGGVPPGSVIACSWLVTVSSTLAFLVIATHA